MPPDAVERFARDLTALVAVPGPDRPLALAVSGGPDSMAMLALAAAAFPGSVIAATVDHRLRTASADEAAMVGGWCRDHGIPHATLAPDTPPAGASIQAQARHIRYALLGDWALAAGAGALATAHHADDQAETFLMRAARGSGPAGLAGIRPCWAFDPDRWTAQALPPPYPRAGGGPDSGRPNVSVIRPGPPPSRGYDRPCPLPVVRPLLTWRRTELRTLAAALPFIDDPSNTDPRHDRTAARTLLARGYLDPQALAAAAAHCREVDAALTETVDWLWRTRRQPGDRIDMSDLPRELRRRLVRRAIGAVRRAHPLEGGWSDSANVESLLDALDAGGQATQAGVLVSAEGARWHFRPAPPRRSR
ncbi:tRNA lysidine(34) synthetase TilS [Sphingomonas sp. VNH70]|uniref:tRNA lysidine(34) synthetase TilS n=1 Tax=Sphingomonas silueang TaxID=3156617 RepID=UPI0032B48503